MFYSWIQDFSDDAKKLDNLGYLIGSFTNPEMVKKMLNMNGNTHSSSDEEFEEASRLIMEQSKKVYEEQEVKQKKQNRRKKRTIK